MTLGVKGKVQETIAELSAQRTDKVRPRDISLRQFVAEKFPKADGDKPLSMGKFLHEIDVDLNRTTVDQLMADDDNKHLMPEIIRQGGRIGMGLAARERAASLGPVTSGQGGSPGTGRFLNPDVYLDVVNRGLVQGPFYQDLIIREETVPQKTVTMPHVNLSDAAVKTTAEGETIDEGTVSYGDKVVTLAKKARGLKITYEAIRYNTLSFVQIFFADAGRLLGNSLNNLAVDALADGDQDDGSEAAAVIGVEDTDDGITWLDLARVAVQGSLIGRNYTQAIGTAAVVLAYLNMDEMKRMFFGSAILPTQLKTPISFPSNLYASAHVGASKLILNDPSSSLIQLTSAPLMVEADKVISKQIEESFMSITTGFAKVQRTASLIIDGSITYSGHEFPTWMAPFSE